MVERVPGKTNQKLVLPGTWGVPLQFDHRRLPIANEVEERGRATKVHRGTIIAGLVVSTLLAGCANNPYSRFYRGQEDARKLPSYDQAQSGVNISYSVDIRSDVRAAIRHGYFPVGEAAFHGNMNLANERNLRSQAEKVGATLVIVASKQTGTQSGAVPWMMPNNSITYSSGTATAYGPAGVVNAYGSGVSTTYGSQAVMIPYTVRLGDSDAVFLAKMQLRTGLVPRDVPEKVRLRRQTNAGVEVFEVVEGTAAYQADVLPGDIVVSVNGEKVESLEQYGQLLNRFTGTTATFVIERNGKMLEKPIYIKALN